MATERNLVSKELNRIKELHGLTHKSWAEMSGVPIGTVSRYLSYNVGVPNFAHICSMLGCIDESVEAFYASVNGSSAKADVPAFVPESTPVDPQRDRSLLASMQERVSEQNETILEHLSTIHEQDAQIREIRAEMRSLEKTIAERDASIARREQRNSDLAAELKTERRSNKRMTIILVAFVVAFIALAAVYIWDVRNLHEGLTALFNPDLV